MFNENVAPQYLKSYMMIAIMRCLLVFDIINSKSREQFVVLGFCAYCNA